MVMFELGQVPNMKGIKIIHINAQSLFNKLDDIVNNVSFCDSNYRNMADKTITD